MFRNTFQSKLILAICMLAVACLLSEQAMAQRYDVAPSYSPHEQDPADVNPVVPQQQASEEFVFTRLPSAAPAPETAKEPEPKPLKTDESPFPIDLSLPIKLPMVEAFLETPKLIIESKSEELPESPEPVETAAPVKLPPISLPEASSELLITPTPFELNKVVEKADEPIWNPDASWEPEVTPDPEPESVFLKEFAAAKEGTSKPKDVYGFKNKKTVATPASFATQPPTSQYPESTQGIASDAWQNVAAPTPGHNERVNMSPNLSLNPPPIPGQPVNEYLPVQPPAFQQTPQLPNYDPGVGHRSAQPTRRFDVYPFDDGEKFGFETKKREFPPFGEIIATGRFFYMAEALWAEPQFQGNTLIATESPGFGESISDDFDSDFHPRFRFGFESPYGPGIEFSYFNINSNSEIASFTSDGVVTGQTNAWVIGRNVWSRILADNAGETLAAQHSIDIDSFTVSFFKELKFPISRVNGNFGFQYVSIAQQLNANVTAAGGGTVETLQSSTDMRAFGPRAILEYYRPIGHTPLELVTTFGGSVLFGQRDQFVTNSQTGLQNRLGADEFLTILDFLVAVQYTKTVGENRAWYGRLGFMNQTWIGGGSATFPQGDFGLRGLTFGIGYNR